MTIKQRLLQSIERYRKAVHALTVVRDKPEYSFMTADIRTDSAALAAWQELDAAGKDLSAATEAFANA